MYLQTIIIFSFVILSGCASTAIHEPDIHTNNSALTLSYCIKSSSDINAIKQSLAEDENKKEFERNIKLAITDIHEYIEANIYRSPVLIINYIPLCLDNTESENLASDLVLTIELSGYGSIKEKWKKILIGTGIAEGVIQGIVVGAATQNPWLGVAVAAEEITAEYLTWNGVDWFLGDSYAPVTLEGSLYFLNDQKVLWQDSSFITENDDELNDDDKKDKVKQLHASLHKTELELMNNLNGYLQNEVIKNITK